MKEIKNVISLANLNTCVEDIVDLAFVPDDNGDIIYRPQIIDAGIDLYTAIWFCPDLFTGDKKYTDINVFYNALITGEDTELTDIMKEIQSKEQYSIIYNSVLKKVDYELKKLENPLGKEFAELAKTIKKIIDNQSEMINGIDVKTFSEALSGVKDNMSADNVVMALKNAGLLKTARKTIKKK